MLRLLVCSALLTLSTAAHAIEYANINVIQHNTGNTGGVNVYTPVRSPDFQFRGANRGDIDIRIGANSADDFSDGVLITSVRENGRDNSAGGDAPGVVFSTSSVSPASGGGLFIPIHNAPGGAEWNVNVAAGYFPFSQFTGAMTTVSANGGAITGLVGSPNITLGSEFVDNGNGVFDLNIPGVNSQNDGVLLVNGAKNEDNYALSRANPDGSFTIYSHDNGSNGSSYEQDPVAFTYIPKNHPSIVVGRIDGNGTKLIEGAPGSYTAAPDGTGTVRLSIPGQTPSSGVLLISPEGGDFLNTDNIVNYEADGNDWLIETRDLTGVGLQSVGGEHMASFAFIPTPAAPANAQTLAFRQGTNGYTGFLDVIIDQDGPSTLGSSVDQFFLDGPSDEKHGLMRFDDLIGPGPNQIPAGSMIIDAELTIHTGQSSSAAGSGGPYTVHQMLVPFDQTVDFFDFAGGSGPVEGVDISTPFDAFSGMGRGAPTQFDVAAILQAWANGDPNYGFDIAPGTSDGWQIFTSGTSLEELRPMLEVTFIAPDLNAIPEPTTAVGVLMLVAGAAVRRRSAKA